jgi:hypothetical protein
MRIHHLYEDEAGVSHFRDIEVAWEELRGANKYAARQSASGIYFVETTQEFHMDWHPAPRRQYVINLDATTHVTAGDGETRAIQPGDVTLVEDTTGRGHITKCFGDVVRRFIYLALD